LKIDRFNELIRAEIMWSRDGHAGIRFVNEMIVVPKAMQKIFDIIGGAIYIAGVEVIMYWPR
ncbi:MAG: hypothetical protein QF787_17850, partial [Nitrospinota bacterium]|nr:hypothetical protein [Nitrospinota bacterium]